MIKSLNLFNSDSEDVFKIGRERKMTYLYMFMLLVIFFVLAFYVGFSKEITMYTFHNPSEENYQHLGRLYPDTLVCPCNQTNIPYWKISEVHVTYHQICSSDFISPIFIGQLYNFDILNTHKHDFMMMSAVYFTHLRLFCEFIKQLIANSYGNSFKENFFASEAIGLDAFEKKINNDVISFTDLLKAYANRGISELLEVTTIGFLISVSSISFNLLLNVDGNIDIRPIGFENCSCIVHTETCSTAAAFYHYNPRNHSLTLLYEVMGVRLACSPFLSTMHSNLACWYSSECYNTVSSYFRFRYRYQFIIMEESQTMIILFGFS